jgi:hypothetical protein
VSADNFYPESLPQKWNINAFLSNSMKSSESKPSAILSRFDTSRASSSALLMLPVETRSSL